jgi:CRP/FNR family cyclic AMP-dependent transcriptional regulator
MFWGQEPQRAVVRERMKLLLAAHHSEVNPQARDVPEGTLLLEQGARAEHLLLLTQGRVAIQLRPFDQQAHTLAVVEAEELLGEMGLFGNGTHSADVRVVEGDAQVIEVRGDDLLKAMLFDIDLAMELLALLSERCMHSNQIIGLLLGGIHAAHDHDVVLLQQACERLDPLNPCLSAAAAQLRRLTTSQP